MTDVKGTIVKLLALSRSPEQHEAQAALLKARQLMMKYKLSERDLEDIDPTKLEIITIDTGITFTKYTDNWISSLANVIAEHHCCDSYFSKKYGKKRRTIMIMGVREDAELVEQIFLYARSCIYAWIDNYRKQYRILGYGTADLRPTTDSYAKGFIAGLNEQYERQNQENQEWGLVAVIPKEVQDYMSSLTSVDLGYRRGTDFSAYNEGVEAGSVFTMKDKLSYSEFDPRKETHEDDPEC